MIEPWELPVFQGPHTIDWGLPYICMGPIATVSEFSTVEDGITENSISPFSRFPPNNCVPQYNTVSSYLYTIYILQVLGIPTGFWILSTVVSPRSGEIAVLNVPPVLSNSFLYGWL